MTTVMALHPAPMSYLPARKRIAFSGHLSMRTPVSLRRAERDGFEPVRVPDSMTGVPSEGLLRDAEGLWQPMSRLANGSLDDVVTTDHLAWYLEGEAQRADLSYVFARTPVAGHVPLRRGANAVQATAHRGLPLVLDGARRIDVDGRTRAERGVVDHIDRNVRILTGSGRPERAYVRYVPTLALFDPFDRGEGIWRTLYGTNEGVANGMVCQPSDIPHMREVAAGLGLADRDAAGIAEVAEALGPGDWYEDVRALVANVYAGTASKLLEGSLMTIRDGDARRQSLDPMMDRMRSLALHAEVGLAQGDDPRAAIAALIEAIEASGKAEDRKSMPHALVTALRGLHLDPVALPHMGEDGEALAGLAPRR